MKRSKSSDTKILAILKQAEGGLLAYRKYGTVSKD